MSKRIFSLVLSDELVNEADKLASVKNTSRSNIINEILAEYFGMPTAEKKIHDIFTGLKENIENREEFRIIFSPSDKCVSIKSSLKYKYNPAVHYSIILCRETGFVFGELRAVVRTQNKEFLSLLNRFFVFWSKLELGYRPDILIEYEIYDTKYIRRFKLMKDTLSKSDELPGNAIAKYLQVFHDALQMYIEDANSLNRIKSRYLRYLKFDDGIIL